jgi:bud emergence protein 1
MVYGVVMYDFKAERPDELEANAGDAIIVIAQSNPEWFVAKPIGRLGGPGLIPVSFIEIRDMTTGQAVPDANEAVQRAGVPKVEEWKKMVADYKNSSISLGRLEAGGAGGGQDGLEQGMQRMSLQGGGAGMGQRMSQQQGGMQGYVSHFSSRDIRFRADSAPQQQHGQAQPNVRASQHARQMAAHGQQAQPYAPAGATPDQPLLAPISASIPRYWFSEDKYWFVIEAQLADGRHWELQRYYEDFYDFQIALLTEFPDEAGNGPSGRKRTLPYMPGPVSYVTDQITDGRRHNLDAYVKNLLQQPSYISRCTLVKQFFAPREGDYEVDPDAPGDEGDYRRSAASGLSSSGTPDDSRQGSSANLPGQNGANGNGNGNGYGGLGAAPAPRPNQGQGQGQGQPGFPHGQPQRQPSGPVNAGGPDGQAGLGGAAAMKVKIYFGDDLFAIRVPRDVGFAGLLAKIRDRLKIPGGEEVVLSAKEERTGGRVALGCDEDVDGVIEREGKLVVFVDYS